MGCSCGKNKVRPFGVRDGKSEPSAFVLRTRLGQQR